MKVVDDLDVRNSLSTVDGEGMETETEREIKVVERSRREGDKWEGVGQRERDERELQIFHVITAQSLSCLKKNG